MTEVAIISCEKNESRCPGDDTVNLARILKSKGTDAKHFRTCTFAPKTDDG